MNNDLKKHILYLDASAYKESLCPRRLQYIIDDGIRGLETSPSLSYGTAFHKFRATLRITGDFQKAILDATSFYAPISASLPNKEWRTLSHLMQTCGGYYRDVYEQDTFAALQLDIAPGDTRFLIEQKFAFPVFEDTNKHTYKNIEYAGLVVMLCGTVDEIGLYQPENIPCIMDAKTSASLFQREEYLKLYRKSVQLMFYKYVVEKMLPQFKGIACQIDGVFIGSGNAKAQFQRSELIYFSDEEMSGFEVDIKHTISQIVAWYYNRVITNCEWPTQPLSCDTQRYDSDKVGKCKFFDFCSIQDPETRQFILDRRFNTHDYNPLLFDEERV